MDVRHISAYRFNSIAKHFSNSCVPCFVWTRYSRTGVNDIERIRKNSYLPAGSVKIAAGIFLPLYFKSSI
jgi:hypothetical protein